ncbi:MAG: C40 family peptidase [Bacteroidales bacterium]|jgi:cell wall-associated NlpC family hydrolase|nr:C40 family peptidase [Bacteroidales bacterium]
MKHLAAILFSCAALMLTGCQTLRNFMARDLEDEDFIISQLYADEHVAETPVIATRVNAKPQRKADGTECMNALGLECSGDDNQLLYETINSWLGVPYKYGGTDRNGIDCSAFVGTVYRKVYGINLHRTSNDMLQDVTLITRSQLREGDLLFFTNSKGKVSHVGIYLKNDLFAHSSTSNGVSVSKLDSKYWTEHFYKGGRVK